MMPAPGANAAGSDAPPLISIVVAVFNRVGVLERCLDSIARQTFRACELLVADGGSTDGSLQLVEARARGGQIAWHDSLPDSGIYAAWNRALGHARGDWICFLGADDHFWSPESLERLAPHLAAAPPDCGVVYGSVMLLDAEGRELYRIGESWDAVRSRFRAVMCLPHPGLMHRRALFAAHGVFDESFRVAGDYELLLRELRDGEALFVNDLVVAGVGTGGLSSAPSGTLRALGEVRRAQRKNGIAWPPATWLSAYLRAAARIALWRVLGERTGRRLADIARRVTGKPEHWTRT